MRPASLAITTGPIAEAAICRPAPRSTPDAHGDLGPEAQRLALLLQLLGDGDLAPRPAPSSSQRRRSPIAIDFWPVSSAARIASTPRMNGQLAHRALGGSSSKPSVTMAPSSSRRTATRPGAGPHHDAAGKRAAPDGRWASRPGLAPGRRAPGRARAGRRAFRQECRRPLRRPYAAGRGRPFLRAIRHRELRELGLPHPRDLERLLRQAAAVAGGVRHPQAHARSRTWRSRGGGGGPGATPRSPRPRGIPARALERRAAASVASGPPEQARELDPVVRTPPSARKTTRGAPGALLPRAGGVGVGGGVQRLERRDPVVRRASASTVQRQSRPSTRRRGRSVARGGLAHRHPHAPSAGWGPSASVSRPAASSR